MNRVTSICLFILALFCFYQGWFRYGFWENNTPGSGFIPVITGILLAIISVGIFIKNGKTTTALKRNDFYPVIGGLLLLVSIQFIGMILSIAAFIIIWLSIIEKFKFYRATIYGISTTAVIYIVFKVSLNVPLPTGIIGI